MARYIVYGCNPWVEDTILGEFDNKTDADIFENQQKIINMDTKKFSFITSKVIL